MRKIKEILLIVLIGLILSPNAVVWGQDSPSDKAYQNKLESILSSFKNYRYSNVSIFRLDSRSLGDLKKYDNAVQGAALGGGSEGFNEEVIIQKFEDNQDLKDAGGHYGKQQYEYIKEQARNQIPLNEIKREIALTRGWRAAPDEDVNLVYNHWKNADANQKKLGHVYVVTERVNRRQAGTSGVVVPKYIIAAMFVYERDDYVETLREVGIKDIYTAPELKDKLDDTYSNILKDTTLYDHIYKFFQQGTVQDVTLEAQGIGSTITYAPPKPGQSSSVETGIDYIDLQNFLRISEGQPLDMKSKKNELIVSADYISWKRYDYVKYDEKIALEIKEKKEEYELAKQYYENAKKEAALDPNNKSLQRTVEQAKEELDFVEGDLRANSVVNNMAPPVIGFELKYGMEEIGYPSLWSERMKARFLWNGVKLGAILPSNGWSAISSDVFGNERSLTHTDGVGISANFDFDMPIIPESGVFQMGGNFVFGDAVEAKYHEDHRDAFEDGWDENGNMIKNDVSDYLIRYDARLFYTFAIAVDESYQFRFGIGGNVYQAEEWYNTREAGQTGAVELSYEKRDYETVGGVCMKADFMSTDSSTPWGTNIQYFDNGLYGNIWMQVPVIENTFSIRLDAKGFVKAFDDPRPWEQESVFMPSVRLVMFF